MKAVDNTSTVECWETDSVRQRTQRITQCAPCVDERNKFLDQLHFQRIERATN